MIIEGNPSCKVMDFYNAVDDLDVESVCEVVPKNAQSFLLIVTKNHRMYFPIDYYCKVIYIPTHHP